MGLNEMWGARWSLPPPGAQSCVRVVGLVWGRADPWPFGDQSRQTTFRPFPQDADWCLALNVTQRRT